MRFDIVVQLDRQAKHMFRTVLVIPTDHAGPSCTHHADFADTVLAGLFLIDFIDSS